MTTGPIDPDTRDLLAAAVPRPEAGAHVDWADVLERAGAPTKTRGVWPRPRVLAAVAVGALLLVSGGALAAIHGVPWWEEAEPPVNPKVVDWQLAPHADGSNFPPRADRSRARTVAKEDGAALVAAPVGDGGYCLIPSLPGDPDLGFSCVYQPDDMLLGYARPPSDGTPRWIIYGRVVDPEAATLDLSKAAGVTFEVPLQHGGFFLANVPEERWDNLSGRAGEGRILDHSGETLRTGCVNWGPAPSRSGAGLARYPFWTEDDPCRPRSLPGRPRIDLDKAQRLVALLLSVDFSIWDKGTTVAVWRAPALDGRECIYVAPVSPQPRGVSEHLPGGGGVCGPPAGERPTSQEAFGPIQISSGSGGLVVGEVGASRGIVRVELHDARGSTTLPFANGYFLGQLPEGGSPGTLPPGGPFTIVGYDATGKEVATADLKELIKVRTPG
jgi:hypothetical protein